MSTTTMANCECGGTGKVCYIETHANGRTYMTRLCACRENVPPREGKAQWWTQETVFSASVDTVIDGLIEIVVKPEVPISAENYRVVRRGNRYYPTTIDVEVFGRSFWMHTNTARELAQRLIQAADAADAIDLPDIDACGHWAPCDCGKTAEQ